MIKPTSIYKEVKRHEHTHMHTGWLHHKSSNMSIWIHLIYAKENSTLLSIARSPAVSFQHHTRVFLVRLCVCVCVCVWSGSSGGALMADEWPSRKRSATLQGWCGETSSTHQLIKCQRVRLDRKRGREREGEREREREAGRRVWEGGGTGEERAADR